MLVKQCGMTKNSEFVNIIMAKYQRDASGNFFGLALVYRRQKKEPGGDSGQAEHKPAGYPGILYKDEALREPVLPADYQPG